MFHVIEKRELLESFETRPEALAFIEKQHPDVAQYLWIDIDED